MQGLQMNWNQITPQYMPWGHSPASPAAPLVTFTAGTQEQPYAMVPEQHCAETNHRQQTLFSGNFVTMNNLPHSLMSGTPSKRKAEPDFLALPKAKQHITEERMAEHMSRLHISSESQVEETAAALEEPGPGQSTRQKRLYVCEEMRRLQTESVLPSSLLNRIERPCMAVMLWQPPVKVPDLLPSYQSTLPQDQQQNDQENNNSSTLVDLNQMDMDS